MQASISIRLRALAEPGHRDIAFFNHSQSELDAGYSMRADDGFKREIQEPGLKGVTWLCRDMPIAGYEAFTALLAAHPAVTAFIVMHERAMV